MGADTRGTLESAKSRCATLKCGLVTPHDPSPVFKGEILVFFGKLEMRNMHLESVGVWRLENTQASSGLSDSSVGWCVQLHFQGHVFFMRGRNTCLFCISKVLETHLRCVPKCWYGKSKGD